MHMYSDDQSTRSNMYVILYLRSFDISLLKAFSQAYILMTRIPEITSFMMRTRLSVTSADLNLIGRYVLYNIITLLPLCTLPCVRKNSPKENLKRNGQKDE